jgi:hypothetical protein
MSWILEGKRVWCLYLGEFPCVGTVTNSRVKYGGKVSHTIQLETPLKVYGVTREVVLFDLGECTDDYTFRVL